MSCKPISQIPTFSSGNSSAQSSSLYLSQIAGYSKLYGFLRKMPFCMREGLRLSVADSMYEVLITCVAGAARTFFGGSFVASRSPVSTKHLEVADAIRDRRPSPSRTCALNTEHVVSPSYLLGNFKTFHRDFECGWSTKALIIRLRYLLEHFDEIETPQQGYGSTQTI